VLKLQPLGPKVHHRGGPDLPVNAGARLQSQAGHRPEDDLHLKCDSPTPKKGKLCGRFHCFLEVRNLIGGKHGVPMVSTAKRVGESVRIHGSVGKELSSEPSEVFLVFLAPCDELHAEGGNEGNQGAAEASTGSDDRYSHATAFLWGGGFESRPSLRLRLAPDIAT